MKNTTLIVLCLFVAASAPAATLKMPPAPELALEIDTTVVPHPLTAGLFLSADVRSNVYVVKTSPFDKIKYPIGEYTFDLFNRNLPQVLAEVVTVDAPSSKDVEIVISIEIVRFEAIIPNPAYNPYTATVVYKITVQDPNGETLLVQTVTGEGQTSKGMMSGFKAKQLAAESAVRAMNDAATQALEALFDAPELAEIAGESSVTP
jgi:hypothetical protein